MPRHPPFQPVPYSNGHGDFCSKAGAKVLADRIKAAWRTVGIDVETHVERVGVRSDAVMFTVRLPGLVNGLPVRQVPA